MSIWWFLPPLVLLVGALVLTWQVQSIRKEGERLATASRRLRDVQPALVRVRSDVDALRARIEENHRR
jgi:hypothetical protein